MDRKSAREQFSDLLGRTRLSDEEYARLRGGPARNRTVWWRRPGPRWAVGGLAACLLLSALLFPLMLAPGPDEVAVQSAAGEVPATVQRISMEVVTNHIHTKPMDHATSSFPELAEQLDQLDFRIRDPRHLTAEQLQLLGARYCTLQGRIATHILFRGAEGHIISHYQAAYHPAFFGEIPDIGEGEQPLRVTDRGFTVEVWREDGLLMARASAM